MRVFLCEGDYYQESGSPITSLDFAPSIAPFVGVSSYALEIEHVFLPGERKNW